MNDPFQIQRELRYGAPVCDQILIGRYFTIGYSWYFRQAKWTLEIVDRHEEFLDDDQKVERKDYFRADLRIPRRFRAGLEDFEHSGFARGHLVASANMDGTKIQNSETFLLSNMSPQKQSLNGGRWKALEESVRNLNAREDILETYVLTAPVFYFNREVRTIGDSNNKLGTDVPVPHAFVKSVLAETKTGRLRLWTFLMENPDPDKGFEPDLDRDLKDFLIETHLAERWVGGIFWDRIHPDDLAKEKSKEGSCWE